MKAISYEMKLLCTFAFSFEGSLRVFNFSEYVLRLQKQSQTDEKQNLLFIEKSVSKPVLS